MRRLAFARIGVLTVLLLGNSPAHALDLEAGDWLVGGFSAVWRVRNGTPSVFCQDASWRSAFSLLVDSQDRVAFLAEVTPGTLFPSGVGGFGLFRCATLGGATELLALFPTTAFDPMTITGPLPYPTDVMAPIGTLSGALGDDGALHLSKRATVAIDDTIAGGEPQILTEDVYVMGLAVRTMAGGPRNEVRVVEYRPSDGTWRSGPQVVTSVDALDAPDFRIPDMVDAAGDTISAAPFKVGLASEPIEVTVDGNIGGSPFALQVGLFGGLAEVPYPDPGVFGPEGPFLNDNATMGPTPCAVMGSPYSREAPAEFDGSYVTWQSPVGLAMNGPRPVFAFNNVSFPAFAEVTNFRTMVRDPGNPANYFQYPFTSCGPQSWFKIDRTDPEPPVLIATREMAASENGALAAINSSQLFRVQQQNGLIAESFDGTSLESIAGYPPPVSPSTKPTVIVRIDSPLDVLVTTFQGRKLGVESGLPVNELGNRGYDSGPPAAGEPRIYAIHADEYEHPALICPNPVTVDAIATAAGTYTFHVYTLDLANGVGHHLVTSGSLALGEPANLSFSVAADGTAFLDRDGDSLADDVETNTGVFVGPGDTGTDPDVFDTDMDGFGDGFEVESGSDPTDPSSTPARAVPVAGDAGEIALVLTLALAAGSALRRRASQRTGRPDDRPLSPQA